MFIGSEKNNIGTLINLGILYKRYSQNDKSISLFEALLSNNYLTGKNKGTIYSQLASLYSLKNDFKKSKDKISTLRENYRYNFMKIQFARTHKRHQRSLSEIFKPSYIF